MPSVCSCHSLNIPKCSSVTKSPRGPAWPKSVTHREMEEAPQCSSLCAVSVLDSSASSTQQPQPFPGIHPTPRGVPKQSPSPSTSTAGLWSVLSSQPGAQHLGFHNPPASGNLPVRCRTSYQHSQITRQLPFATVIAQRDQNLN